MVFSFPLCPCDSASCDFSFKIIFNTKDNPEADTVTAQVLALGMILPQESICLWLKHGFQGRHILGSEFYHCHMLTQKPVERYLTFINLITVQNGNKIKNNGAF